MTLFKKMEVASHAAMVMFQMRARPDALSQLTLWIQAALAQEKSSTKTRLLVSLVSHTPELKEKTPSVFQTNAMLTKSSHGKEAVLTALKDKPDLTSSPAQRPKVK